jgi:hypothetical protein
MTNAYIVIARNYLHSGLEIGLLVTSYYANTEDARHRTTEVAEGWTPPSATMMLGSHSITTYRILRAW